VEAVVVGLNFSIDYKKIAIAADLIMKGAIFVGTNPDPTFPGPDGLYPGAGTMIAAVQTASGTAPQIMGKPKSFLYQLALDRAEVKPGQALMIGDRLETDILGAQEMGIRTAVVLTGIVKRSEAENWDPAPDMIKNHALEVIAELGG
jgi:4-nitrophenyl phosphatase